MAIMSSAAYAKVEIRFPILLHTSQGHTTYNVSDFQKQLEKKGVEIPETVNIANREDAEVLDGISQQIDDAGLEKPKGNSLYMLRYGRLSDYAGAKIDNPVCYRKIGRTVSDDKAAREAYALVRNLADSIVSDQYTVLAYRFAGDDEFTLENVEEGEDGFLKKYLKIELQPGDVQIIATTNDSGDDDDSDVLSLCE